LRFYDGQNPLLLQTAFDNFEKGCIYPMLYRDEINIPAVMNAFSVDEKTAENYLPFGCGEYIIDHASVGTPSGLINLAKVLDETLKEREYAAFDALWEAYKKRVEKYVDIMAWQERFEYKIAAETAPYLYFSLLFDDCIERNKPIFGGGVRYLGGTLESYGNTNTADSLTAIKKLVYDEKKLTYSGLMNALNSDFENGEDIRRMLKNCPKFGNDDADADGMAQLVHDHICLYTRAAAQRYGLDSYLIVIINNNANAYLGMNTGATADGRRAKETLANANNPSGGCDKNGITAFLNSLTKLDNTIHAGAVQNIKVSRAMTGKHRAQFESLLKAYFQKGQQAMLNILSKGEMEDALIHPEKHADLIVRVGGFSARFIDLDRFTQADVLSRTLY
jgi:pyruvate-formate lyase